MESFGRLYEFPTKKWSIGRSFDFMQVACLIQNINFSGLTHYNVLSEFYLT